MADGSVVIETKYDGKEADQGLDSLQKKFDNVANKAKSIGTSLSKYVTAPLTAVGVGALAAANEFDKATKTIRAGTGATGKDLEALTANFKNVFKGVPEDAATVSSALADINTRTGLTGKPLENLTKQFLDLSRITGEDVNQSIANITRVFGDWGIATEDTGKTMDYLWKVSQTTGIGVDQLSQKVVQFGAPLRQIGFSLEESGALLGKWEKEGVNTELVMGGLRVALGKMAQEGKEPQKEFPKIIEQIKNAGSAGEANAIALENFGARAGADMAAAIREGRFEIDGLMKTLGSSEETIGKAAKDTITLSDQFDMLKNNTMIALEPIGKILLEFAQNALPPLIEKVQQLAEWFGNLSPQMQTATFIFGAVAAAIGPIIIFVGQVISAVQTFLPILSKLKTILTVVRTAFMFLTGPIGIIIAIVTLLAIVIYKNWDSIAAWTTKTWSSIVNWLSETWNNIQTASKAAFEAAKQIISNVWENTKTLTSKAWNYIKTFISTTWDNIKKKISSTIESVKNFISTAWTTIKNTITNIITSIKNTISTIFNSIKDRIKNIINNIRDTISNVLGRIKTRFTEIWNQIKDVVTQRIENLKNAVKNGINGALNIIKGLGTSFKNAGKGLIDMMVRGIKNAASKVTSAISSLAQKARNFLPFSPAKEGPLSDLDKLDFGGPIQDSIKHAIPEVKAKMAAILKLPSIQGIEGMKGYSNLTNSPKEIEVLQQQPSNLPDGMQATINIGGYELKGFINFLTTQQVDNRNRNLRQIRGQN